MNSAEATSAAISSRIRWRRLLLAAAVILLLAILALVTGRNLIAERLARGWLAQRHVPAGFQVRSLSMTGLDAKVRLGPLADPDLTVESLQVSYGLTGPWDGHAFGVVTRKVRFWRPRVKAQISRQGISFGSLDPLLRELRRRPAAAGPLPEIAVSDGYLALATPLGPLQVVGNVRVDRGALAAADLHVASFSLRLAANRVGAGGASLRIEPQGGHLVAALEASNVAVSSGGLTASAPRVKLAGNVPRAADGHFDGSASLKLDAPGLSVTAAGARASATRLQGVFIGDIDANLNRQRLSGRLSASTDVTRITSSGAGAQAGDIRLDLDRFVLSRDATGVAAGFDGVGSIYMPGGRAGDLVIKTGFGTVRLKAAELATTADGWKGTVTLTGRIAGEGGLDAAAAGRVSASSGLGVVNPDYRLALAKALEHVRVAAPAWTAQISNRQSQVWLTSPISLQARSGARLVLGGDAAILRDGTSSGRAKIMLAGGGLPDVSALLDRWTATPSGLEADGTVSGQLDSLVAQGVGVEVKGRASASTSGVRFLLAQCAPVTARRVVLGPNPVIEIAARVCPEGPLFEAGRGGWRALGLIEALHAIAPSLQAEVSQASGSFSASGTGKSPTFALTMTGGRIADLADAKRFFPVSATGQATLARGIWTGDFAAATPGGRPIAKLKVRHDTATSAGRADIAAGLVFAPGGLQPVDLTPAAQFAKAAQGPVAFSGDFQWEHGGVRSRGELVARDLRFKSPAGAVLGLDADIHFTSLAPLLTASDQSIAVRQVQGLAPLQGLSAVFDVGADAATIARANAGLYGGQIRLEAMHVPFAEGAVLKGALDFDHVDLGKIVAGSNLSDQVKVEAVINGRIPFEAGPNGITIRSGELAAVGPGRISIARAALKTPAGAGATPGVAEDLAYQAMENLAFDKLDATMTSIPGDRLSILFHVRGRHDPPKPQRASIAIGDLIAGTALKEPIPLPSGTQINLTLDTTLNFGELVRAIEETWRESLGQAPRENRSAPVQGGGAPIPPSE